MPADKSTRSVIDDLVTLDQQPTEEQMAMFRRNLGDKVTAMKRGARRSRYFLIGGFVLFAIGYALVAVAARGQQNIQWLTATGISIVVVGALVAVGGAVGLLINRGFGYVWARQDLHDAGLMELSLQVQRLSQQIERRNEKS
jgi:hypothetical protein